MRIAESVTLTCWPPAPDERNVSMRRSPVSISGASAWSSAGTASNAANAVWRRALRVERRDADEPVHALLAGEHAVGVPTLHRERGRADPGLGALADVVDLDREAPALRPAREHAQQHLRPVLRVGAAGTRAHLADRVALVVLAGEQRAELEPVELGRAAPRGRPRSRARRESSDSSRPSWYSVSRSSIRSSSPSMSSTSSRTPASSLVTLRAASWSSQRSGRPPRPLELGEPVALGVDVQVRRAPRRRACARPRGRR